MLGFVLMVSQAIFYNAIYFNYALVLTRFYGVADDRVCHYLLKFALGNFIGPLVLGPFFDIVGRRCACEDEFVRRCMHGVMPSKTWRRS